MLIDDGTGTGYKAKVDDHNRLSVIATTHNAAAQASEEGFTFFWTDSYDYAAADTILWLANTSTTMNLFLEKIHVASDTTTLITVHSPAYAAPAGTAITGTNANRASGRVAEAECYRDEENNSQGVKLIQDIIIANTPYTFPVDGKIELGYHNCVAVDFVTVGTLAAAVFVGYFSDENV